MTLTQQLMSLVTLAKTDGNAVESIRELKRQAEERKDWRARQQCDLAIRHALASRPE
jgi:translation initiation factor IF-2